MKLLSLSTFLFSVVGIASFFLVQPALANDPGQLYKAGELQPVKWHKSRIEARVMDVSPKVTYDKPPAPDPIYVIPTTLPRAQAAPVIVLPGPAQNGGASGGIKAPPGFAVIDPNNPAPARFGTNIPAGGLNPAKSLPSGVTTNRLSGIMSPPKSSSGMTVGQGSLKPSNAMNNPQSGAVKSVPQTASYANQSVAGIGSGGAFTSVKTSTNGRIIERGALLK